MFLSRGLGKQSAGTGKEKKQKRKRTSDFSEICGHPEHHKKCDKKIVSHKYSDFEISSLLNMSSNKTILLPKEKKCTSKCFQKIRKKEESQKNEKNEKNAPNGALHNWIVAKKKKYRKLTAINRNERSTSCDFLFNTLALQATSTHLKQANNIKSQIFNGVRLLNITLTQSSHNDRSLKVLKRLKRSETSDEIISKKTTNVINTNKIYSFSSNNKSSLNSNDEDKNNQITNINNNQNNSNNNTSNEDNLDLYPILKKHSLPPQCAIRPNNIAVSRSRVSNATRVVYVGFLPSTHRWTLKNLFYPGVIRYAMEQANLHILAPIDCRLEGLTTNIGSSQSLKAQTDFYVSNASAFIGYSGYMEATLASAWNLPLVAFVGDHNCYSTLFPCCYIITQLVVSLREWVVPFFYFFCFIHRLFIPSLDYSVQCDTGNLQTNNCTVQNANNIRFYIRASMPRGS